jgi:hypothetical protein
MDAIPLHDSRTKIADRKFKGARVLRFVVSDGREPIARQGSLAAQL